MALAILCPSFTSAFGLEVEVEGVFLVYYDEVVS